MAKKFGKVLLFGLIAGATAAGVYHYLQNKNNGSQEFDDFDDFDDLDNFDDLDDEIEAPAEERSYVSLDKAKVFAGEAVDKAKELISKGKKKLQDKLENASTDEESDDDDVEEFKPEDDSAEEKKVADNDSDNDSDMDTEEFFDDDEA